MSTNNYVKLNNFKNNDNISININSYEKAMTWSGLPLDTTNPVPVEYNLKYSHISSVKSNIIQPVRKHRRPGHPNYASLSNYNEL
jgi:hypothetical protein